MRRLRVADNFLFYKIRGRLGVVDDFLRHRVLRVVDDLKRVVC
jgi:hypothetical protein